MPDRKEGVDICSWLLHGLIFLLLGLLTVFVKSAKICVLLLLLCEVLGTMISGILQFESSTGGARVSSQKGALLTSAFFSSNVFESWHDFNFELAGDWEEPNVLHGEDAMGLLFV